MNKLGMDTEASLLGVCPRGRDESRPYTSPQRWGWGVEMPPGRKPVGFATLYPPYAAVLLPSLNNVVGQFVHSLVAILIRQPLDIAAGLGGEILGDFIAIL